MSTILYRNRKYKVNRVSIKKQNVLTGAKTFKTFGMAVLLQLFVLKVLRFWVILFFSNIMYIQKIKSRAFRGHGRPHKHVHAHVYVYVYTHTCEVFFAFR